MAKAFQVWKKLSIEQLIRGCLIEKKHWGSLYTICKTFEKNGAIKLVKEAQKKTKNIYELVDPRKFSDQTLILNPQQIAKIKARARNYNQ